MINVIMVNNIPGRKRGLDVVEKILYNTTDKDLKIKIK